MFEPTPAVGQPAILPRSGHSGHPQPRAPTEPRAAPALSQQLHEDISSGTPEGLVPQPPETLIFTLSLSTGMTQSQGSPWGALGPGQPAPSPDLPNMAAAPARPLSSAVAIAPRSRRALRRGRPAGKVAAGPALPWTAGRSRWTWPRPR